MLTGLGTTWAWTYDRLKYAQSQTRIATASEEWLDLIAQDYLGNTLRRRMGESDASYRSRILLEILRVRDTRPALTSILTDLTGTPPFIFEPRNPMDTGGYNVAQSLAYGVAGGYGNLNLPYQLFLLVDLPIVSPVSVGNIAGYGVPIGAYGTGALEYISAEIIAATLSDVDVYEAINDVMAAGTIAWTATGFALPSTVPATSLRFNINPVIGTNPIGEII